MSHTIPLLKTNKRYTEQEVVFIKDHYKTHSYQYIAAKLGRTEGNVMVKVWRLGLRKKISWHENSWSEEQLELLRAYKGGVSTLSMQLHKSPKLVKEKAKELNITLPVKKKRWGKNELALLSIYFSELSMRQLEGMFDTTYSVIRVKAKALNLDRTKKPILFSKQDVATLKKLYSDFSDLHIAMTLGKTVKDVSKKAKELGLVKKKMKPMRGSLKDYGGS